MSKRDKVNVSEKGFADYLETPSETADEVKVAADADSREVARAAILQNTGFALDGDFNIADGQYLIGGKGDPEYKAYAIREGGEVVGLRLQVEDWAVESFKQELREYKERWEASDKSKTAYSIVPNSHVTGWIAEYLNFHFGVHPTKSRPEFDKVLATEFPECFIIPGAAEQAKKWKGET